MLIVPIRRKTALWCLGVTVAAVGLWTAYALKYRPVLVHTPGDWDCACGEIYIKTTMRGIWNPFRDRQPEIVANDFLSKLRANECAVSDEVCRTSLPSHRVSAWKLSYREDAGATSSLYYKLTKYGDKTPLGASVGVIDVRKTPAGWRVIGFDSYF
jgi:hypothetical protein